MPAPPLPGSPTPFNGQAADFDRRAGLPEVDCRAIAAAVLARAGVHSGDRVLEIGAGTGMIGRFLLAPSIPYVGMDLSRGMLEVFRHRPEVGSRGTPPLVQADGAGPWPLADGSVRVVFSSRAIHLLPRDHVVREVGRVAGDGGSLLLGRVERQPESVKARLSRRMQALVRERGLSPRTAGGREILAALVERGAETLPRQAVVRWPVRSSPADSLAQWWAKEGLGGVVLPPGVQEEVLTELAAWAAATFGDLEQPWDSEEAYVLEGARLP